VRDGILRTRFNTKATEDAAAIVYVVNLGITFINTDTLPGRSGIVGGYDVNAF
jgi:hypothetical protein